MWTRFVDSWKHQPALQFSVHGALDCRRFDQLACVANHLKWYLSGAHSPLNEKVVSILSDELLKPREFAAPDCFDILVPVDVAISAHGNRTNLQATKQ
jgi:hypothetical protein